MRSVLVVGGNGALGRAIVSRFSARGWSTINIDFNENKEATQSVVLDNQLPWTEHANKVSNRLKELAIEKKVSFDAVVCAAGGWAGGKIGDSETLKAVDSMWKMNVQPAVTASHLAAKHLSPSGILVLTGAQAALEGTPGMIGYGMSKAATHHLVKSIASQGLPEQCTVHAVLPVTIDTPTNRKFMPESDWTSWTKPQEIADQIVEWSEDKNKRPPNGELVQVITKDNVNQWI